MTKPKLLDVFCCQGGASMGYHQAGFEVYGIDIGPQPRYPFPFLQADAIQALRKLRDGEPLIFTHKVGRIEKLYASDFAVRAGSPPCQAHTNAQKIMGNIHPELIKPTRELFIEMGGPYVIENVPGSPLLNPMELCGSMFALGTYRHRLFEANWNIAEPFHPRHVARTTKMGRAPIDGEMMHVVGNFSGVEKAKQAMGINWMNRDGLRESIPPAYTEWIGGQIMRLLETRKSLEAAT